MNAETARWTCSAAPSGRLLAVFAAAAFLLAGLTGNSFSLHVGMTSSAHVAAVAVDHVDDDTAWTPAVLEVARGESAAPVSVGSDGQRLMHLIGACLAVLALAVLLLRLLLWSRFPETGYPSLTALPRIVRPLPDGSWTPPPPVPPRSSPVIRT